MSESEDLPVQAAVSRRDSNRLRARSQLQRRIGLGMLLLGGLMVITAAWLVFTGIKARHELTAMKADLTQLRADISSGNLTQANAVAADLAKHAQRAHSLTTGPAWWTVSVIPGVGAPFRTARGIGS